MIEPTLAWLQPYKFARGTWAEGSPVSRLYRAACSAHVLARSRAPVGHGRAAAVWLVGGPPAHTPACRESLSEIRSLRRWWRVLPKRVVINWDPGRRPPPALTVPMTLVAHSRSTLCQDCESAHTWTAASVLSQRFDGNIERRWPRSRRPSSSTRTAGDRRCSGRCTVESPLPARACSG